MLVNLYGLVSVPFIGFEVIVWAPLGHIESNFSSAGLFVRASLRPMTLLAIGMNYVCG